VLCGKRRRYLRERGRSVYTLTVAEDVNSTFNNLQFLKRIFLGERNALSEELDLIAKLDYEQLKQEFQFANGIIFTLGNIFHLEADGSPTLNSRDGSELVAETFEETVTYLREILRLLTKYTGGTLLTSVSPIPISGYRGNDFKSAVEADCLSKSQLRASLFACQKQFPNLVYVPTFEVFRWLAAHQTFASFGTDDDNPRHISAVLIKQVMDKLA